MKVRFVFSLTWALLAGSLCAATLEQLSLDDMIAQSTAIVRGTVTDSYTAYTGRVIYTHYTVEVSERFKGAGTGSVDVAVPGGVAGRLRQTFEGAPVLHKGEEYVFFLWTGAAGPTQVVGLTQGLFAVGRDGSATRTANQETMLEAGTGRPVRDTTMVMPLGQLRSRITGKLAAMRAAQ